MEESDVLPTLEQRVDAHPAWEARLAAWVGVEVGAVTLTPDQHARLLAYLVGEAPL